MMSKLLPFFQYIVILIILVLVTSTIGWDLERHDSGYLRPIFYWIFGYFSLVEAKIVENCAEIVEICETPLASLTIAKISRFLLPVGGLAYLIFRIDNGSSRRQREARLKN